MQMSQASMPYALALLAEGLFCVKTYTNYKE